MMRFASRCLAVTGLVLGLGAAASGESFQLVVAGSCPGEETLTVAGATPDGVVEVYLAAAEGMGEVPSGPCAGTELGLADPVAGPTWGVDGEGGFSVTVSPPGGACGVLLQPVDAATCAVGNVARLESGHPAPVPKTGQTESYGTGDDGDLERGVEWPQPRFTDRGDGTVTDHLTGLLWLRDAGCLGCAGWESALAAANGLADGSCGLADGSLAGDWRLPNVQELHSLIDSGRFNPALPAGHPFDGVGTGGDALYWTSTTLADLTDGAWFLLMMDGDIDRRDKATELCIWPVRGSTLPGSAPAPVPRTGQTTSHGARDDGELREGVAWPEPRFGLDGDGTVTDRLTGLVWLQDRDCLGPRSWEGALDAANALADPACGLTDGSAPGDWRLPNVQELQSVADYGAAAAFLPRERRDAGGSLYWTSNTYPILAGRGWHVSLDGNVGNLPKDDALLVLPVRGGE